MRRDEAWRFSTGASSPHGKETVVRNLMWKFLGNEQGATAIEYGLIAAGISVAIIAVVQGLGTSLNSTFTSVSSALK
jgi:pilus assembly protein Flp/PilA